MATDLAARTGSDTAALERGTLLTPSPSMGEGWGEGEYGTIEAVASTGVAPSPGKADQRCASVPVRHPRPQGERDDERHATQAQADPLAIDDPWRLGYDWPVVMWIAVVHLGALAAPFFFTWKALGLCAFLCWFTGSIGVCLGYHRHLTHGAFTTYRPVRWLLALLGGLSGEGSALTWVANHRKHHMYSDQEGDPHSPRDGRWWSHMLWFMPDFGRKYHETLATRFAPDIAKDRVMRFLHVFFLPSHVLFGAALFAVGYFGWNAYTGWSFVVWGMFVRLVYVLHVTWFVNSATHLWGYRNYETSDDSRNLWWVGILAFGEGWHNNHHAYQRMARQGHKWWEIDVTYWAICVMEKLGLAWNVQHEIPKSRP